MWLFRGAQSAVFFYAACTPCASYHRRRKRRKDAARTQRYTQRDEVVTDQPTLFHQAFPFSTNSYWGEEITLGPGPPTRRGGHKNAASRTGSQRTLVSPEKPVESPPRFLGDTLTSVLEDLNPPKKEKDVLKNDRWNLIRYQREDEVLWGGEVKGSSVGLSGRGRASTSGSAKYYTARNPEVNDLHPPVVCGPRSRAETRWMLQPPPSAKVMAGKVQVGTTSAWDDSREGSVRRASRLHMLEEDESGPSPENHPEPISWRHPESKSLMDLYPVRSHDRAKFTSRHSPASAKSTSRRSNQLPPIVVANDPYSPLTSINNINDDADDLLPRRPALATLATTTSTPSSHIRLHKDDTILNPTPSLNSRPTSPSPLPSYDYPSKVSLSTSPWPSSTPEDPFHARPASKATADSGKAFYTMPTNLTSITPRQAHLKDRPELRGIQFEFGPDSDDEYDRSDNDDPASQQRRIQRMRPFRWSMDI